jgi:hypothetical protein
MASVSLLKRSGVADAMKARRRVWDRAVGVFGVDWLYYNVVGVFSSSVFSSSSRARHRPASALRAAIHA